eukprot:Tbor_TRINITY_DN5636_c1_g2::TRINITY_DN5636_c1_g2_i7::g.8271::m.8271
MGPIKPILLLVLLLHVSFLGVHVNGDHMNTLSNADKLAVTAKGTKGADYEKAVADAERAADDAKKAANDAQEALKTAEEALEAAKAKASIGGNKTTTLSATDISSTIPAVLVTSVVFLY